MCYFGVRLREPDKEAHENVERGCGQGCGWLDRRTSHAVDLVNGGNDWRQKQWCRELYTLQGSVATIYIGEVGKVITFRCQVSSGCRAPKLLKSVDFFSWSHSKNKWSKGAFIETWCIVRLQWIFRPRWLVVACVNLLPLVFFLGRLIFFRQEFQLASCFDEATDFSYQTSHGNLSIQCRPASTSVLSINQSIKRFYLLNKIQ